MLYRESYDRDNVRQYVEAVRKLLGVDSRLHDATERAAAQLRGVGAPPAKVSAALPAIDKAPASSGGTSGVPYLSRDPVVSLVQSCLNSALAERDGVGKDSPAPSLWNRLTLAVRELLHPGNFSPGDPDWVIKIAESTLEHLAKGNHPFNPVPAEHTISDSARLIIVGDWGTGLPRARAVASYLAEEVAGALESGREAHVIHLGDVYYSGLPSEYEKHVFTYWPVSTEQAQAGVTSWSLNGNHDMYSGGFGYFDTLLADPRFINQRSPDGAATSFFRLSSPSWEFVGLDTSWDSNVLSSGAVGVLNDPQAEFVTSVSRETDKKLVLLSHHQYMSVYEQSDIGTELGSKLAPVLQNDRVTAWLWGHEHRCMGFHQSGGVKFPRCLGHGGVPVLQNHAPEAPVPPPGAWEERDFLESENERWGRFGFAALDLSGGHISARYRNDLGVLVRTEEIA